MTYVTKSTDIRPSEQQLRMANDSVQEARRLERAAAFALTPRGRRAIAGR